MQTSGERRPPSDFKFLQVQGGEDSAEQALPTLPVG